jgi:hypothetical protein
MKKFVVVEWVHIRVVKRTAMDKRLRFFFPMSSTSRLRRVTIKGPPYFNISVMSKFHTLPERQISLDVFQSANNLTWSKLSWVASGDKRDMLILLVCQAQILHLVDIIDSWDLEMLRTWCWRHHLQLYMMWDAWRQERWQTYLKVLEETCEKEVLIQPPQRVASNFIAIFSFRFKMKVTFYKIWGFKVIFCTKSHALHISSHSRGV